MSKGKKRYKLTVTQRVFSSAENYYPRQTRRAQTFIIGSGFFDDDNVDFDALEKAYFEVVRRHDSMRLRLNRVGFWAFSIVRQRFEEYETPQPLKRTKMPGGREAFYKFCMNPKKPIISMYDEHLTQAEIFDTGNGTGGLVIYQHHISSDGYSLDQIIYNELCEIYETLKSGGKLDEPKKLYNYEDYAKKTEYTNKKKVVKDFFWWFKQYNKAFKGYVIPVNSKKGSNVHEYAVKEMSKESYGKLAKFCDEHHCSLPSVVAVAFAMATFCLKNSKSFLFSMLSHGRKTMVQKHTTGSMQTDLPIFFRYEENKKVETVIEETYMGVLNDLSKTRFPYMIHGLFLTFFLNLFRVGFSTEHLWLEVSSMEYRKEDKKPSLELIGLRLLDYFDPISIEVTEVLGESLIVSFACARKCMSDKDRSLYFEYAMTALDYIVNHDDSIGNACKEIKNIVNKNQSK